MKIATKKHNKTQKQIEILAEIYPEAQIGAVKRTVEKSLIKCFNKKEYKDRYEGKIYIQVWIDFANTFYSKSM